MGEGIGKSEIEAKETMRQKGLELNDMFKETVLPILPII